MRILTLLFAFGALTNCGDSNTHFLCIDSKYNNVIAEAETVVRKNGLSIELYTTDVCQKLFSSGLNGERVETKNISTVTFYPKLCDGATGLEGGCQLRICDTSRPAKSMARTLLHEFGHCLGLDHVADKNNIMYYMNTGFDFTKEQIDLINRGD